MFFVSIAGFIKLILYSQCGHKARAIKQSALNKCSSLHQLLSW